MIKSQNVYNLAFWDILILQFHISVSSSLFWILETCFQTQCRSLHNVKNNGGASIAMDRAI